MAKVSDFLPYVLPYVPGCPVPLAEQHIRDICIDFCANSTLAQEPLDPLSVRAGVSEYELTPPDGMQVHMVMRAWFQKRELVIYNTNTPNLRPEMFNAGFTDADTAPKPPTAIFYKTKNVFVFSAPPDTADNASLTLLAALKPTRSATTVPDILFDDYAFEIGQGVAASLQSIPAQPFTDLTTIAARASTYEQARSAARVRANKSLGRSQTKVVMRPLA